MCVASLGVLATNWSVKRRVFKASNTASRRQIVTDLESLVGWFAVKSSSRSYRVVEFGH